MFRTIFTLVTLFRKLAINIVFLTLKPFSKEAVENDSKKKNRMLTFLFQLQLLAIIYIVLEERGSGKLLLFGSF